MKMKDYYRDMDKFRATRERQKRRYRARTGSYKYKPRPWTLAELELVEAHSIPDRELSAKIERSVSAIQMARSRIKKGDFSD